MKSTWTWSDLKEEDQERLIELLDELIQILSSDNPLGKIEIIKDIRNELAEIKRKVNEEYKCK